jgi:hypothetical protein
MSGLKIARQKIYPLKISLLIFGLLAQSVSDIPNRRNAGTGIQINLQSTIETTIRL